MKKGTKLYNLILPIWLLFIVPSALIFILAANFLFDLLVSALALRFCGAREIKKILKGSIVRTWLCGFAADFAGTALMILPLIAEMYFGNAPRAAWIRGLSRDLTQNPFAGALPLLWTLAAVALSAIIIFKLNYKFCFRRVDLTEAQRRSVSLALALFTAPWLFLLPTAWLYGF